MASLYEFDESRRSPGSLLAGVDEAGRGPWAGPVVAAAVVLRPDSRFPGLNDSKKISPAVRDRLYDHIRRDALAHAVAAVEPAVIDEINILQATFLAMRRALEGLGFRPGLILIDGNRPLPHAPSPQETIVQGDGKSASIAAASILAKVARDRLMTAAHDDYPRYGFAEHKGYGTPAHRDALERFGPCPLHRRSFSPVKEALECPPGPRPRLTAYRGMLSPG